MNTPDFLERPGKPRLAYHKTAGKGDGANLPGVIFLGGFRSDMSGTKAEWLENWAQLQNRAFLRFDYSGHGESEGDFAEGCIGDWAADAADALTSLTEGPQILVGSSMGGWIALLLMKRFAARVAGLVGIAAAPDFTEDGFWANLSEDKRSALQRDGRIDMPSDFEEEETWPLTLRLIEDGRENLVLRTPLETQAPVRLLQGTEDKDVTPETALNLFNHLTSPNAHLTLVKGAGHRFSELPELILIAETMEEISEQIAGYSTLEN